MNEEQQKEFEEMKRQIAELLKWKEEREKQQITRPLDSNSINVLKQALQV